MHLMAIHEMKTAKNSMNVLNVSARITDELDVRDARRVIRVSANPAMDPTIADFSFESGLDLIVVLCISH